MAEFDPFSGMSDLGKGFGDMFGMGDIFSSFTRWVDSITRMSDIDVVGLMTLGLATVIIFVSIYGIVKEKQASQMRLRG